MRYALISDVHGNLPALEAVLHDIAARPDVTATCHLGDLVGYAPWPNEVVDLIRARHIAGVAGNYDSTIAADYKHCGCQYEDPHQEELAHLSYEWTRRHVSGETRDWLRALPFRIDLRPLGGHAAGPTVTLLHGNQVLNTVYVTEDRSDAFLAKMGAGIGTSVGSVICIGHTHRPWHRIVDGVHYVNTGSVGRPRDGDWRAAYVLLDVTVDRVCAEVVRVEYDLDAAVRGIVASELPEEFADHLTSGGRQAIRPIPGA